MQSGRLHQGTVSLSFLLDKVEGAAVLGTADFLPLPPCGPSLGYSSPPPHLGIVLVYTAFSQRWCGKYRMENSRSKLRLQITCHPEWQDDISQLGHKSSFVQCKHSARQPASVSGKVRTRPQPL